MTEIEEMREELDAPEKIEEDDFRLWLKELTIAGYDITFHWTMPKVFHGDVKKKEFVSRSFKDMHGGVRVNIWKKPSRDSHYLLWTYKWAGGDWWMRRQP